MKKIKVKLNLHKLSGEIVRLGKIENCELIENRVHSVVVRLPDGAVIIRKKPHQVEGEAQ